jgi:hypothetical protein
MGLADILNAAQAVGDARALNNIIGSMQASLAAVKIKNIDIIEERFESLQNTFGLSTEEAARYGQQIDELALSLGRGGAAAQDIITKMKPLMGIFGSKGDFAGSGRDFEKSMVRTSAFMRINLKLSDAVANKYIEMYAGSAKGLEEQLVHQVGLSTAIEQMIPGVEITRDLMSDMANVSSELTLHYGKLPGDLELAVLKSRQLGINMAQLNTTGQNLLNIESSIGQEMEYQLLSGRRLVDEVSGESLTNAYREATIKGEGNKQAEILNKLLKQEGKTLESNMFARQQMAQLLNMDEGTLTKMMNKQKLLAELDPSGQLMKLTGKDLEKQLHAMQVAGTAAVDIAGIMKADDLRTTDEKLAETLDVMTTKGILATVTNLGGRYDTIATGASKAQRDISQMAADAIVGGLNSTLVTATSKTVFAGIGKEMGTAFANAVIGSATTLAGFGGGAYKHTSPIPVTITPDADGHDFYSGPGGGRMLLGPAGALSIDNNDVVMAGTDLFSGKGSNGDMMQFAAAVVNAINNQTRELKSDPVFGRGLTNSYYG